MATLYYNFNVIGHEWDMGPACANPSINPAPATVPCIYIIHNSNSNETYVGYAFNARHRWRTRTEAFHCFGIEEDYAQNILCAYCIPCDQHGNQYQGVFQGANSPEHLLIRAVRNGVLGVTTCTNTQMRELPCIPPNGIDQLEIHLPAPNWGGLLGDRYVDIHGFAL